MTLTENEIDIIDTLVEAFDGKSDAIVLAQRLRDYCACTLRDPKAVKPREVQSVLYGITHGTLWPTDLGGPNHALTAYWARWDAIMHEALHDVLGHCPDA